MKHRAIWGIILIIFLWPAQAWCQPDSHALFFSANQAYKDGNFEEAASIYEALIKKGATSGDVYYNLGNCFLRMDKIGLAILNYERAKILMPRNPDVNFNLGYAKDKCLDQAEKKEDFSLTGMLGYFTGMEIFWTLAGINALLCVFAIIRVLRRSSEWNFYIIMALGLLWLTLIFFGAAKYYGSTHGNQAVVVAKKIDVRAGPDKQDTLLFQLHDGSGIMLEQEENDWRLIRFSQKKRGWTPKNGVMAIMPERKKPTQPEAT